MKIFLLSVNILGPVMLQPNSCSVFLERSPLMMFGMDLFNFAAPVVLHCMAWSNNRVYHMSSS